MPSELRVIGVPRGVVEGGCVTRGTERRVHCIRGGIVPQQQDALSCDLERAVCKEAVSMGVGKWRNS